MRRALVLTGGGAKGSWQVGACQHLIAERGYWFDVISGVSVGAINAATLAHGHDLDGLRAHLERLRSEWFDLRGNHDVYRRRWLGPLGLALGRWEGLFETTPLRERLTRVIDPAQIAASPIQLRIGYTDLRSGGFRTARNDHPGLVDAALASSSLPLLFPPVPLQDGQELGVDGGVRKASPLSNAFHTLAELPPTTGPDEIWLLLVHPPRCVGLASLAGKWPKAAFRWLSLVAHEAIAEDIQRAEQINALVRAGASHNGFRYVRLRVVHPLEELEGTLLDFDPTKIRAWYEAGLHTAREAVDEGERGIW
jgi:NTE family protein